MEQTNKEQNSCEDLQSQCCTYNKLGIFNYPDSDIVAFSFAELGACGSPGRIEVMTIDKQVTTLEYDSWEHKRFDEFWTRAWSVRKLLRDYRSKPVMDSWIMNI